MALPTASLGQLASMNMPYQMPQYEVTRGRDKVLAAIAAGVGQALAGRIVDNVTSRDFAEQPAGFWSKLIQGPQESREQYDKRTAQTAESARAAEDRAARERMMERQIGADREKEAGRDRQAKADRDLRWKLSSAEADQRNQLMVDDRLAKAALQNEAFAQERLLAEQKLMDMVLGREVDRQGDLLDKRVMRGIETDERIREREADPLAQLDRVRLEMLQEELGKQAGGGVDPNKRAAVRAFMQSRGQGQPVTRTMPAEGTKMSYEDFLAGGLPAYSGTATDLSRVAVEVAAGPKLTFSTPVAGPAPTVAENIAAQQAAVNSPFVINPLVAAAAASDEHGATMELLRRLRRGSVLDTSNTRQLY